ncbi:peptidase M76, partial [Ochromonadaceae sp. CCMP2298]
CRQCEVSGVEGKSRAFITEHPHEIVLCVNRLPGRAALREALTHEGVHAFDYANGRCDFSSCDGLAYTEVRAAREGECADLSNALHTLPLVGPWLKQSCIKSRAAASTGNLFPGDARSCVERVFLSALADLHP